jgi:hypothetical protein
MKNERDELIKRFLCKDEIEIIESDYDFLFHFETYKKAILDNIDKELLLVDNGKMYHTSWRIFYKDNNCYYPVSDTLQDSTVSSKIYELYPYSNEEIEDIKNNKLKDKSIKELDSDIVKFGKYKNKKWIEVKELDSKYIDWLIKETKDNGLKKKLELL